MNKIFNLLRFHSKGICKIENLKTLNTCWNYNNKLLHNHIPYITTFLFNYRAIVSHPLAFKVLLTLFFQQCISGTHFTQESVHMLVYFTVLLLYQLVLTFSALKSLLISTGVSVLLFHSTIFDIKQYAVNIEGNRRLENHSQHVPFFPLST